MRFALGVAFCLLALPAAANTVTLRFVYEDRPLFPYYLGDGSSQPRWPGVTIELLRQLEKKVPGLKISFERMPWQRCLASVKKGSADAVVASYRKDREDTGVFPMAGERPDPGMRLDSHNYVLYKLRTSPLTWDGSRMQQLEGSVGAPLGYAIVEDLRALGVRVEESHAVTSDLWKLRSGKLAAVAAPEAIGDYHVREGQFTDVVKVAPRLATKDYYLMVSHSFARKHPDLTKKIWSALAEISQAQTATLIARYLDMTAE